MENIKRKMIYPLLVVVILLCMTATSTEYSFAAESFDVSHKTKWVQGQNIDSGLRIKTKDGKVAYCLNQGAASPSGAYTDKYSLSSKVKGVLYHGYPNNKIFGTKELTADQAICATQLAVWAHDTSNKGNNIDLGKLHGAYDKSPDGEDVLAAAKWLYKKTQSGYSAPDKPSLPKPKFKSPTNKTPEPYDSTYTRVGPYSYTTTDNKYTKNNKVSISLDGAPAGSKIGDKSGQFNSKPHAGTDFYIYLPASKLNTKGSKTFNIQISYDYEYENSAVFTAYKKDSTQNVAVSTKKDMEKGTIKTEAEGAYSWTTCRITKQDSDDSKKGIPDTEFKLYYDPTPQNTSNNDWIFMSDQKTDKSGVIKIPGLGTGRYKLVETKPNPNYGLNSEFGEKDEIIFNISNVNTESIQIMKNRPVQISCQVQKDTIQKTSAAYRSLPNQEDIDNTNKETYRYHVDYRSTSNTWADEFVVDDYLEGVAENKIRVTEIWTPVCYGDADGKMNIWYRTNNTDNETMYSDVKAVDSNPKNPNNPNKKSVKSNIGFKLWAENVDVSERRNLKVDDLDLDDDEYITKLRIEHGKVEKGFTTNNSETYLMNTEDTSDWTPCPKDNFYNEECLRQNDLKPLTYLVKCPNPLSPPEVIENSVQSFIYRNVVLEDDDDHRVTTGVIDTFEENPDEDKIIGEVDKTKKTQKKDKLEKDLDKKKSGTEKDKGVKSKTGDQVKLFVLFAVLLAASLSIIFLKKKNKDRFLSLLILFSLLAGSFAISEDVQALSKQGKIFKVNSVEYALTSADKIKNDEDKSVYSVEYMVNQEISAKEVDNKGINRILPDTITVNVDDHKGNIKQNKKEVTPIYTKKQAQVDKTELVKGLYAEEIKNLPTEKVFQIRSAESLGATTSKKLKRAGISLTVTGHDKHGVPNKWDAKLVFRGLENYLEKTRYNINAQYGGNVYSENKLPEEKKSISKKQTKADPEKVKELVTKPIEPEKKKVVDKNYVKYRDQIPSDDLIVEDAESPLGNSQKTGDLVKGLFALAIVLILSTILIVKFMLGKKKFVESDEE